LKAFKLAKQGFDFANQWQWVDDYRSTVTVRQNSTHSQSSTTTIIPFLILEKIKYSNLLGWIIICDVIG
jgi:hypothetical protein